MANTLSIPFGDLPPNEKQSYDLSNGESYTL